MKTLRSRKKTPVPGRRDKPKDAYHPTAQKPPLYHLKKKYSNLERTGTYIKMSDDEKIKKYIRDKGILTRRNINDRTYDRTYDRFADPFYAKAPRRNLSRLSNISYERGYPDAATYNGRYASHANPYARKEPFADKKVQFFRSHSSTQELTLIISATRHGTLADVRDDVCETFFRRGIFLSESERYIHTAHGNILKNIYEFEHGGKYFFGPAHIFDMNEYDQFSKTNSPAQSASGSNKGSASKGVLSEDSLKSNGGRSSVSGLNESSKSQNGGPSSKSGGASFQNGPSSMNGGSRLKNGGASSLNKSQNGSAQSQGESKQSYAQSGSGRTNKISSRLSNLTINDVRSNRSNSQTSGSGGPTGVSRMSQRRRCNIKITVDHNPKSLCSFIVDESRHRNIAQLMSDLSFQLHLRTNQITKIFTMSGRLINRVDELFLGDHFNAMTSSFNGNGYGHIRYAHTRDPINRYADYHNPYQVTVEAAGTSHVFELPSQDYYDQIYRRGAELYNDLQLDWVYGYNGRNCRNNIMLLPSEELLYFVAKVVVIFNDQQQTQRFYAEHTDEIRSIAQHPSNLWQIATGQVSGGDSGDMAHVRIWDSKILVTLNVLEFDSMNLSVECLDFCSSDNGERLATVANDNGEWYLTVWDWEEGIKLSHSEPYEDHYAELDIQFDPFDSTSVVTCGKEHVFFWDVSQPDAVYRVGFFEDYSTPEYVTCCGFNHDGRLITGDSNGYIHVWDTHLKRTLSTVPTNHTGSIITLRVLSDFHVVTGGGADRKLTLVSLIDSVPTKAEFELPEHVGGVVSIVPLFGGFSGGDKDFDFLRLVVGTSCNSILAGSMTEAFECIVKGISDNMVPAFAVSPTDNTFLTAGTDNMITSWSTETKADLWEVKHTSPLTSASYNANGGVVAVGNAIGRWFVYDASRGEQLASFQCDRSAVSCISFSPENDFVAIGMESGVVFFYRIHQADYKYFISYRASQDEIVSMDWSTDSKHIRIVNKKFDMVHWNMQNRVVEHNRNIIRNLRYESETTTLSFQTSGVWADNEDGLVFKTADRKGTMLMTGTNTGAVRLFQYPCDVETMEYRKRLDGRAFSEVKLHSSEISKVCFFLNDRAALTCGLEDFCIAQWKMVRTSSQRLEEYARYRYHPRHATDQLHESLNASSYYRRPLPPTDALTARSEFDTKREGNGSLSGAKLYKRETMNGLMRKSLTDK
ncbi:echinoderm microtubule-associated protein-like 4 isoform X2 [Clytia hemisphaerica]|uniref:echinoderm microtubule-associated protein-like 4 isoform X2 n=1 Tax=Clytia hemisphaerica TaxID=252671 RepID=UPI0034D73333